MAKMGDIIEVDWNGPSFKCPGCGMDIRVRAFVKIKMGTARRSGEEGYNTPIVSTSLEAEFAGLRIHHECFEQNKVMRGNS